MAAIAAVVAVGVFGSAAWLRARAIEEGTRRGFVVTVDHGRMGWFAAHLSGVHVALEGVPDVAVEIADVDIEIDARGHPTSVAARGGAVRVTTELERAVEAVRAWRARRPPVEPPPAGATPRPPPTLSATAISLFVPLAGGGELAAEGLAIERSDADVRVSLSSARAERGDARATSGPATVTLHEKKLRGVNVEALVIELGPKGGAAVAAPGASAAPSVAPPSSARVAASAEPAPPMLPAIDARGRGKKKSGDRRGVVDAAAQQAAPVTDPFELKLPDVMPWRARAVAVAQRVAAEIDEGAEIVVGALSLRFQSGGERLTLGPGRASVLRTPEQVEASFASTPVQGSTPLTVRVELPLGASPMRAAISGGPVTLTALGVEERAFGLTDVARAELSGKVNLALDGQGSVTFDADVTARRIGLERAWLASAPVHGLDVGLRLSGLYENQKRLRVDDAEAAVGAMRARFRGTGETLGDHARLSGFVEVPVSACQSILDSVPEALVPTLHGARLTGTFGAMGRFAFDTAALDDLELVYRVDDHCHFAEVPRPLDRERFRKRFVQRIVRPDGEISEMETGPDSANWTMLESISSFMPAAVLTTEDGAFYRHHGFNHAAIKGAVVANLKAKRFVRGASTISMQLAKNLFLSRKKTVSRKLEELVLTDYLEQTFSKDEMMELYLNVIEFGPNVYGITAAAEHYFGRKPEELNLAECMFLATLLPRPVESHKMYERGSISEGWARNLRSLMEIAFRTGKISEAERNEGQTESVVFYKEGQPRPPPRAPITGGRAEAGDDEWKAVE